MSFNLEQASALSGVFAVATAGAAWCTIRFSG